MLQDERMLDAEDAAYMESLKADLEAVLLTLPPREAGVLRMRFGLLDGTEHTLDDIGAQYNVSTWSVANSCGSWADASSCLGCWS